MIQQENCFPDVQGQDIICDLDGTLIKGDIGESTFLHLHLKEYFTDKPTQKLIIPMDSIGEDPSLEIVLKYLNYCKSSQFDKAYLFTSEEVARYQSQEISQVVEKFLESTSGQQELQIEIPTTAQKIGFTTSYGVAIRPRLIKLLQYFQSQGALLWIVSASPQNVADACGAAFSFPPGNVIGSIPDTSSVKNGRFPWKSGKVDILKKSGVLNPLVVIGDGLGDIEMLKIARYPIVMADGHPELVAIAREQGWYLYNNNSEISINGKSF